MFGVIWVSRLGLGLIVNGKSVIIIRKNKIGLMILVCWWNVNLRFFEKIVENSC